MNPEEVLRLKIRLLTEGVRLPATENTGRRGGAGPVGARYFRLPNGRVCGIPIRSGKMANRFGSAILEPTDDSKVWLYDGSIKLTTVPRPKFYEMKTEEGIPYSSIALLHGDRTVATTVYQACRYWARGSQCKFCTIPISYRLGDTVLDKSPAHVAEVVLAAEKEGLVDDVLLTTGTPETPDMGSAKIIETIEAIRQVSNIPIGVQFEPPTEMDLIKKVADAGANAVGIHIENADDSIRKEICPGKHQYGSMDFYKKAWNYASQFFEWGHVSTFILHGLGERPDATISLVEEVSKIGVMPVVTPIRPSPNSQLGDYIPQYVNRIDETIMFYKRVGSILFENRLNPKKTAAGCHKCGGCTPIQEAYDWAAAQEL
jgi:radical SAM protein (TIGR04043 family)